MDILGGVSLTNENLQFFGAGLAAGAALWALLATATRRAPETAESLAQRVSKLELRLAAGKDFSAIARAIESMQLGLPTLAGREGEVVRVFGALPALPKRRPSDRSDPEQVAREFIEALRNNATAAAEIAKAIVDQSNNLNDPKDRREIAQAIKKFGQILDTTFWDRYGEMMLASGLSDNLKTLLRTFFAQVKRLKVAVTELPKDPAFADLDALLDRALDVLDTAVAIIDELNAQAARQG